MTTPKIDFPPERLPLQRAYHWEQARADEVWLTQPMGGGRVRDFTWREAMDEARRMAAHLQAQGWPPGSNVAILSKNCAHWLLSDLAIWMAGHVSVPLFPTLMAESVRQILEHSESRGVFVGKLDDWDMMKGGIPDGVHCIDYPLSPPTDFEHWDDIIRSTEPLDGQPTRRADERATIIYTSGTTGVPKGVMHNFLAFGAAPDAIREGFTVEENDRMLSYLPLAHVAERWCVESTSICSGFRVFFAESLDTFAVDLRRARPTFFVSVPRLWTKFQQGVFAKIPKSRLDLLFRIPLVNRIIKRKILEGLGLDQCRFAGGGAAPMPPSLLNWFRDLGLELLEGYGMTENFGCSHGSFPGKSRVGYVGSDWPGSESRLSDSGEVQTRSPWTMSGYFKDPERTQEALTADGWLRTGDLGAFDESGRLRITGRAKELFKTSKGKYVSPAPIENRLSNHPAIEAVCVMGADHPQPCAVVMLSPEYPVTDRAAMVESLAGHLAAVNEALDPHERLDFLAATADTWGVENGYLTPSMKIKRNVIEATYGGRLDGWYADGKPVQWAGG